MLDTTLDYPMEETWESSPDQHYVVRETPASKVRENIVRVRKEILRAQLEGELAALHHVEHFDEDLPPVAPVVQAPWRRKLSTFFEGIAVTICRSVHRFPDEIRSTDTYLTCMACGRKYALPWSDPAKLPADVYVYSGYIAPKERTVQAELRSKAHARIIE